MTGSFDGVLKEERTMVSCAKAGLKSATSASSPAVSAGTSPEALIIRPSELLLDISYLLGKRPRAYGKFTVRFFVPSKTSMMAFGGAGVGVAAGRPSLSPTFIISGAPVELLVSAAALLRSLSRDVGNRQGALARQQCALVGSEGLSSF